MTAVKEYSKNITISDIYTTIHIQELANQRLQKYTFEHDPPPKDENNNPKSTPQNSANYVMIDVIQEMFKQCIDTNKPNKDKEKRPRQR